MLSTVAFVLAGAGAGAGAGAAATYKWLSSSQSEGPKPSKAELEDRYDKVNRQNCQDRCIICIILSLLLAIFTMATLAPQYFPADLNLLFTAPWWKIVPLFLLSVALVLFAITNYCKKIVISGREIEELRKKLNTQSSGGNVFGLVNFIHNSIHITNNFCSSTFNFTASAVVMVVVVVLAVLIVRFL